MFFDAVLSSIVGWSFYSNIYVSGFSYMFSVNILPTIIMGTVSLLVHIEILYLSVDISIRVIDVILRGPGRDWQIEIRPLVP